MPSPRSLILLSSLWAVSLLLLMMIMSGCHLPQLPILEPLTLQQVIEKYNANANSVPSFQARISRWEIHYRENGKVTTHKDFGGKFFFQIASPDQPEQFYLQADTTLASRALVLACDHEKVWMISKPASRGAWAERLDNKPDCINGQLLHPDLLLELLGLKPLPTQELPLQQPLYELHPETFSLRYQNQNATGLYTEREITFDRRTNLPCFVSLYNPFGQLLVSAELKNYQPLGNAMVPGDITLSYPQDDSYLKLKLRKFKAKDKSLTKLLNHSFLQLKKLKEVQHLDFDCDTHHAYPETY